MTDIMPVTKRILFLTGTRADYGKIEPVARACQEAGFRISFFITGMHMLGAYGMTNFEVRRFANASFHEFVNQKAGDPHDLVLSKTILGLSDWLRENHHDLVFIHGDRVEALAGALVCATNAIRSAHIEGGEVSGTIDEVYRHCCTKLCTHHFVSSEAAARRIVSLGEPPDRVHVVGSPELDTHASHTTISLDEVRAYYEIPFAEYGVAVFHPVTSEAATMGRQADGLFSALDQSGRPFVVILPNNDPGSEAIVERIDRLPRERFRILKSMRFAYFSRLLRDAAVLVGNSSAGVREAPFLGVASLDLGTRQFKRAQSGSITHAAAEDSAAIADFLARCWGQRFTPDLSFGDGGAARQIAGVLARERFWSTPLQKSFHDAAPQDTRVCDISATKVRKLG